MRLVGAAGIASGRSRRIPLSLYLSALLILFAVTAITSAFVVRDQAEQDAKATAREEAQFAANLAAGDVTEALNQLEMTVSSTAKNPAIASVFDPGSPCNVAFGAIGVLQKTHLEFIRPNGAIACSSAGPTPAGISYELSFWLPQSLRGAVLIAPVLDARTGRASVVSAAPAGDRGVVAAFADLTELGTTLATRLAGPRGLEFLVTTPDGKTALARSIEPARWSGAPIDDTAFVKTSGSIRPDLDNTARVYGVAEAGSPDWQVFAGAEQSRVLSSAVNLFLRELTVMSFGLIAVLLAHCSSTGGSSDRCTRSAGRWQACVTPRLRIP